MTVAVLYWLVLPVAHATPEPATFAACQEGESEACRTVWLHLASGIQEETSGVRNNARQLAAAAVGVQLAATLGKRERRRCNLPACGVDRSGRPDEDVPVPPPRWRPWPDVATTYGTLDGQTIALARTPTSVRWAFPDGRTVVVERRTDGRREEAPVVSGGRIWVVVGRDWFTYDPDGKPGPSGTTEIFFDRIVAAEDRISLCRRYTECVTLDGASGEIVSQEEVEPAPIPLPFVDPPPSERPTWKGRRTLVLDLPEELRSATAWVWAKAPAPRQMLAKASGRRRIRLKVPTDVPLSVAIQGATHRDSFDLIAEDRRRRIEGQASYGRPVSACVPGGPGRILSTAWEDSGPDGCLEVPRYVSTLVRDELAWKAGGEPYPERPMCEVSRGDVTTEMPCDLATQDVDPAYAARARIEERSLWLPSYHVDLSALAVNGREVWGARDDERFRPVAWSRDGLSWALDPEPGRWRFVDQHPGQLRVGSYRFAEMEVKGGLTVQHPPVRTVERTLVERSLSLDGLPLPFAGVEIEDPLTGETLRRVATAGGRFWQPVDDGGPGRWRFAGEEAWRTDAKVELASPQGRIPLDVGATADDLVGVWVTARHSERWAPAIDAFDLRPDDVWHVEDGVALVHRPHERVWAATFLVLADGSLQQVAGKRYYREGQVPPERIVPEPPPLCARGPAFEQKALAALDAAALVRAFGKVPLWQETPTGWRGRTSLHTLEVALQGPAPDACGPTDDGFRVSGPSGSLFVRVAFHDGRPDLASAQTLAQELLFEVDADRRPRPLSTRHIRLPAGHDVAVRGATVTGSTARDRAAPVGDRLGWNIIEQVAATETFVLRGAPESPVDVRVLPLPPSSGRLEYRVPMRIVPRALAPDDPRGPIAAVSLEVARDAKVELELQWADEARTSRPSFRLIGPDGMVASSLSTNQAGFYRGFRLKAGTYTLRLDGLGTSPEAVAGPAELVLTWRKRSLLETDPRGSGWRLPNLGEAEALAEGIHLLPP